MSAQARNRNLYSQYRFTVDINEDFTSSAFKQATGLEMTVAEASYGEGGAMAPMKEPGKATFSNVTLSRGVGLDYDMHDWMLECVDLRAKMPIGLGELSEDLFRDLEINQMDRQANYVVSWDCYSCFPVRYKPGEWDFDSDDVTIEEMELCMWFFDRYVY